jgi:hypothetical protein
MRAGWNLTVFLIIVSFGSVCGRASLDPLWLYKDLPDTDRQYYEMGVHDTCRTMDLHHILETDTGDNYDSNYINLDYKFSGDSIRFLDPFDSTNVIKSDYRPGFAGFKIDWDNGIAIWKLSKYNYLVFAHKGPLPNHKVTVRFGWGYGCGGATTFYTIGSVAASSVWKVDSIRIPDSLRTIPDSSKEQRGYYEMQVLINNSSPSDTNKSSDRGIFKIDDIRLVGLTSGTIDRKMTMRREGSTRFFIPPANGPVRISAFSLKGELLYATTVDVAAGKRYSVGGFVKKHAPSLSPAVRCITIKGEGVDILHKIR